VTNGSIDCSNFEDRIHQILDDRLTLTGDDLLMAHVAHCADCEQILKDYETVDDSIKLLPAELAQIIAQADQSQRGTFSNRTLVWAATLAAVLVLTLNVVNSFNSTGQLKTENRDVAMVNAPKLPVAPKAVTTPNPKTIEPRFTPDSSPFSKNFSMVATMPSIPEVPSWRDISDRLDPLEPTVIAPVFSYSSKIPAVRPVHCSLNATISVLKHSFGTSDERNKEKRPDLGFSIDPNMLAAV